MSETMWDMLEEAAERQRLHNSREVSNIAMSQETAKRMLEKILSWDIDIKSLWEKTVGMIKAKARS